MSSRIRSIKPGFFLDDELAEHSPLTRLLFIGLWTLADCEGRLEDRPKRIRAQIHPYDDGDTDSMLQALHDSRFITRYSVDGKRYLEIRTFTKHQRLTGKEADERSSIPAPPPLPEFEPASEQAVISEMRMIPLVNNGETTGKQSGNDGNFPNVQEGKGKEGKGKEQERERESAETAPPTAPREPAAPIAETQPPVSETPPAKTKKRGNEPLPDCPDWLPADVWQKFIGHRQDIKHRLTPTAAAITLRDLDKARGFGHDPVDLIETAIANGWTGCVFRDRHFQPPPPAKASAVPGGGRAARARVVPEPPQDRSQYHHTAGMSTAAPAWLEEESTA